MPYQRQRLVWPLRGYLALRGCAVKLLRGLALRMPSMLADKSCLRVRLYGIFTCSYLFLQLVERVEGNVWGLRPRQVAA